MQPTEVSVTDSDFEDIFVPHCGWMHFPPNDNVARFLREGWCDYREQAFLWRVLRGDDVFVDTGAHAGLYSRLALEAAPEGHVLAIEPNPRIHPYLEENLASAIAAGRATLARVAVAAMVGEARFRSDSDCHSAFSRLAPNGSDEDTFVVEVRTLDAILESAPREEIACLKLDIEGAELLAIQGLRAARGRIRAMLIEFTEQNLRAFGGTTSSLLSALAAAGFTACRWDGHDALIGVQDTGPIWYENLIAIADTDWAAQRLRTTSPVNRRISTELLNRGAASADLHSGELHMRKDAAVDSLVAARAELARAHKRALEADLRSENALRQIEEAWARVGEANWRADEAMKRVDEALAQVRQSDERTTAALVRAVEANTRAEKIRDVAQEQVAEMHASLSAGPAAAQARRLVESRVIAAYARMFMPELYREIFAVEPGSSRSNER